MGGQSGSIGCTEVIEQERIDELTSVRAIQSVADGRVRHNTYMT